MVNQLAGSGVDVSYVCDRKRLETLDGTAVLEALAGDPELWGLSSSRLADYNHVVVATERRGGRPLAVLAGLEWRTSHEPHLLLEAAAVRADARGQWLLRRMLAAMVLRITGLGEAPTVLATLTSDPAWFTVVQEFGRRFRGASCFPQGPDAPIILRSAALAQRVARGLHCHQWLELTTGAMRATARAREASRFEALLGDGGVATCPAPEQRLAVIDLRTETESDIIEDAVRTYRLRW